MLNAPKPNKEESAVMSRWEKILGTVYRLITQSFSQEDCRVLAKVFHGNMAANLERLELIIKHLKLIRKAMLHNTFQKEAARKGVEDDAEILETPKDRGNLGGQ